MNEPSERPLLSPDLKGALGARCSCKHLHHGHPATWKESHLGSNFPFIVLPHKNVLRLKNASTHKAT